MQSLDEKSVAPNPLDQFSAWHTEVLQSKTPMPTAMTLGTSTKDGKPSVRVVLLKQVDHRGFIFFTNYRSRKSREMTENPFAILSFYWPEFERQVRIEGTVERISREE